MHINNLLKLSYWLDPSVLDERAGALMWLVVLAGVVWAAAGALVLLKSSIALTKTTDRTSALLPPDVMAAQILAGAIVAVVAMGRLFAITPLGLRAGWLIAAFVALVPFIPRVIVGAVRDGIIGAGIEAMVFHRPANRYAIGAPRPRAFYYYDNANRFQSLRVRDDKPAWRITTSGLWLALHLAGTIFVMSALRQPLWYGPALIALILFPHLLSLIAQSLIGKANLHTVFANLNLTSLSPLFVLYLIIGARLVVTLSVQATSGDSSAGVIEPWSSILNLLLWVIVMVVYALAISFYHAANPIVQSNQPAAHPSVSRALDRRFVQIAAVALVAGVATWAVWNALTLHTHGVTGSDPYAYAQMGVDLAQHGTVFHQFPLIRLTYDLNIPSDPIIHIGYKLPQDVQRIATTVWPPGYAVFTALAYLLAGEQGLYLVTPLLSLLSLVVVWWLSHTLLAGGQPDATLDEGRLAYAAAALAVVLTATSYQQVEWQLIPMADIAAQAFSLLAVVLAIRAVHSSHAMLPNVAQRLTGGARNALILRLALSALSGISLGIAFDIRYTQVLIAPALLFALLSGVPRQIAGVSAGITPLRRKVLAWIRRHAAMIFSFGIGAFVTVLPVLIYNMNAFGSPFNTGSEELSNFSLARLPETFARITSELASPREFGMLLPLIIIGLIALWRRNRRMVITLALYFVPLFVLHIAYAYLRPRDILSLFPVLSFLAAFGLVWLVFRLLNHPAPSPEQHTFDAVRSRFAYHVSRLFFPIVTMLLLVGLSFVVVLRSIDTLALPVTHGFDAFGYLVREQRESFTKLAELTLANGVIGCSLNSGAVDLYAGRLTFRPGRWTTEETVKFVRALHAENTPVYILEDGAEVIPVLDGLRQIYHLTEIARLDMPYYFLGSGSENRAVGLYKIEE